MNDKQESWEVEFDLLFPACTGKFGSFGSSVEGWIAFGNKQKQFIRETLQKERERVVGVLENEKWEVPSGKMKSIDMGMTKLHNECIEKAIAEITKDHG